MKRILLIMLWAMSVVFPSCNIWEDRSTCPKILAVDCSKLEGKALSADIWIFSQDGSLFAKTRIGEHEFYKEQVFRVLGGEFICCVWANLGSGTTVTDINTLEGKLYAKPSAEADQLFSFRKKVSCEGDSTLVRVLPRKMFIDVYVTVKGLKKTDVAKVGLFTPYNGFSLQGECLQQDRTMTAEGNPLIRLRMLRPGTVEGIKLEFSCQSGEETVFYPDFALGDYLQLNDYDLSSDELKDIYVTIDIASIKPLIGVDPVHYIPPVEIKY